jgi:pimeloyl-ACP methyl ester carboxylesterase
VRLEPIDATPSGYMIAKRLFVLVHSPLVGPYSWALVADALRARRHAVVVPEVRSLEQQGPPYWERHVEAIERSVEAEHPDEIILVAHSGAGRLLPVAGQRLSADVIGYVFVDSDIPTKTESRLNAMSDEVGQQFRDAVKNGLLPPWPEEVFKHEIRDDNVRRRLVSELSPLPLPVYEEPIPVPQHWPDAKCGYVRLSDRYPQAEALAERKGWEVHRFDGDHFFILVRPNEVAAALIELTR